MIDGFSLAVGIAGLIELSAEVIKLSHSYVIGVAEYRKEIAALEAESKCLIGALEGLKLTVSKLTERKTGDRPHGSVLTTPDTIVIHQADIDNCGQILTKIKRALEPPDNARRGNKFTNRITKAGRALEWPFKKGELQRLVQRLERYKTSFLMAMYATSM